jgi:hypothetical protein
VLSLPSSSCVSVQVPPLFVNTYAAPSVPFAPRLWLFAPITAVSPTSLTAQPK